MVAIPAPDPVGSRRDSVATARRQEGSAAPSPGSYKTYTSPSPSGASRMSSIFDLTGRAALVTGGSKGLGKAMARSLALAGADIAIASRSEAELKPALEEILAGTGRK